jgi:hypothetical protein
MWTESLLTCQTTSEGIPLWRHILIPVHKLADLKAHPKDTPVNPIKYGRFVNYRDDRDRLLSMSGWGTNPPKTIKTWLDAHYGM